MGRPGGLRQGLSAAADELALHPVPLPFDALEAQPLRPRARNHDEIYPSGKGSHMPPKAFPAEALDPVTDDRVANLSGHYDPEAYGHRHAGHLPGDEQHEMGRLDAACGGLNAQELCALLEPLRPWERVSLGRLGGHTPTSCRRPRPDACVPFDGDSRGPYARLVSPCGRGSREYEHGGCCAAGTSVSWGPRTKAPNPAIVK
jgi:hypothetical protein